MIGDLWLKTYSFTLDRLTVIPSGPELVDLPAKKHIQRLYGRLRGMVLYM
jgi:hypothetical protein